MAGRAWAALPPPIRSCDNSGVTGRALGEPHSPPSHISKMVPPTIHLGPPNWTRTGQQYPTLWDKVSVELTYPVVSKYRTKEHSSFCSSMKSLACCEGGSIPNHHRDGWEPRAEVSLSCGD